MTSLSLSLCIGATLAGLASSYPMAQTGEPPVHLIHQFPNYTWIENFAFRSNGQIMADDYSGSVTYLVDTANPSSQPTIVARYPNDSCVFGIAEMQPDVFYVATVLGEPYNFVYTPNTTTIWEVDMRHYVPGKEGMVRKAAELPKVQIPNGLTLLSEEQGTLLLADSGRGVVWRVDVKNGAYELVFDDPTLKTVPGAFPLVGVNGVRVIGEELYYTSTNQGLVCKVPISCDGLPTGKPTVISSEVPAADDFDIDRYGNIWLAENVQNTFVRVSPTGHVQTIAGGGPNSTTLSGPVSARFGRGHGQQDTVFVSTDGLFFPAGADAPLTTNGKIISIDTRNL